MVDQNQTNLLRLATVLSELTVTPDAIDPNQFSTLLECIDTLILKFGMAMSFVSKDINNHITGIRENDN